MALTFHKHLDILYTDLALTFNKITGAYTEFSFALKGSSDFYTALYKEKVEASLLQELAQKDKNVSFLAGCLLDPKSVIKDQVSIRKAKDRDVLQRNILSFEINFKDIYEGYSSLSELEKEAYCQKTLPILQEELRKLKVPLWICNYSGNGIHLHFKLSKPLSTKEPELYKKQYLFLCDLIESRFSEKILLNRKCCNPATPMRLPGSINWKDVKNPIRNLILFHNFQADTSPFLKEILLESFEKESREGPDLLEILKYFNYTKFDSMKKKENNLILSSPFCEDSRPSFLFHLERKIYYDFSQGHGGNLLELVARLSKLQLPEDYEKVFQKMKNIGKKVPEAPQSPYVLKKNGIWFYKSPETKEGLWLCSPLKIKAKTRDSAGSSWGRLLEFSDDDFKMRSWIMPMELLAGDGMELRRELLRRGMQLACKKDARKHLMEYIRSYPCQEHIQCVKRRGWHESSYVLPDRIFRYCEKTKILLERPQESEILCTGSLQEWKSNIAQYCKDEPILMFVLAAAFSPPLLKIQGEENRGFHLQGSSSVGKTLALHIAGTVWGGKGFSGPLKRWRSTVNGLEYLAEQHCDSLLLLDELAEITPKEAAKAAYMLANGTGKHRLDRHAQGLNPKKWRLLFLSSGEISLEIHLNQEGQQIRGGQMVRMVDIHVEDKGQGIFQKISDKKQAKKLAAKLYRNCELYYGSPIRAFLEGIFQQKKPKDQIQKCMGIFLDSLPEKSKQLHRVAKSFALLYAAGSLAIDFDILPFCKEKLLKALKEIFQRWADKQGDEGDFESQKILSQIRLYLQRHACSHFPEWDKEKKPPYQGHCSGYRLRKKDGSIQWIILNEVFRKEVCKGFELSKVLKTLKEKELILHKAGKCSIPTRLPHLGLTRAYRLTENILQDS